MSIARTIAASAHAPVVDETGLTGKYNAKFNAGMRDIDSLIKAVRENLGLELKPEARKMKVLVVEKA